MRLPAYAERFVDRGFAAFLFDYRGFGESDGEPRQIVSPRLHLQDLRAAIEHVRGLPEVDGGRVVLWGTSLGGGHVLVTAARDPLIAAVVAQVPHVNALATRGAVGGARLRRMIGAGLRDLLRAATGRSPHYVPAVGHPGDDAMLSTEGAYEGFMALVPPDARFENRCAARIALTIPFYNPIRFAARIRCPTLIVAAVHDELIPIRAVRETARRIRDGRLVELDCRHFDAYQGAWFERAVSEQLGFLAKHL
jgi:pimeloyl-ACP methyl ester carboxylesterase